MSPAAAGSGSGQHPPVSIEAKLKTHSLPPCSRFQPGGGVRKHLCRCLWTSAPGRVETGVPFFPGPPLQAPESPVFCSCLWSRLGVSLRWLPPPPFSLQTLWLSCLCFHFPISAAACLPSLSFCLFLVFACICEKPSLAFWVKLICQGGGIPSFVC